MHTRHERTTGSTVVRRVVATATAMLLFAPGVAWVAGARGRPADNTAPVAFSGFDPGWSSLSAFGKYLGDRLPLRSPAIRSDGWIDEHVFREDPAFGGSASPEVMRGAKNQLFFREDFTRSCRPWNTVAADMSSLSRIATLIADSGRDVVTMVTPNKSTVLSDYLPKRFPERECWETYRDELWAALDTSTIPGWLDVRSLLVNRRSATNHPLYLSGDSHWDSEGSLVAVHALIETLAPGLFDDAEIVNTGMRTYTGDLSFLTGMPRPARTEVLEVQRDGVGRVSGVEIGNYETRWVNSTQSAKVIPGRTVIVGDSFAVRALDQIVPYFEDLTLVIPYAEDPSIVSTAIAGADHVVILIVERNLSFLMNGTLGPEFVDQLTASLAG